MTWACGRRRTPSAGPGPRGSRWISRPRRPGRGPRRCRVPGPRPGAGPSRPCSCAADGLAVDGDHQPTADLHGPGVQPGAENPVQHVGADQGERAPERRTPPPPRGPRPARPGPGRPRRPTARSRRTTSTPRSPPRSRRPAARPAVRRPRLLRGSGTWARRSRRYWLRAAGIEEDVIGGRVLLVAGGAECRNFHRSARALPAARGHAGPRQSSLRHRRSQPQFTTLPGPCGKGPVDSERH